MFSTAILTSLLFTSATLAAPSLDGSLWQRRAAGRLAQSTQYTGPEALANNFSPRSYSANWAGAYYSYGANFFTAVSGVVTIPTPTGSGSAAIWVGIDGASCRSTIFQTGVDLTIDSGGKVVYSAWYEWYPGLARQYFTGFTVAAGHVVKMSVTPTSPNSGIATIENMTTGQTATTDTPVTSAYSLCFQDVEWIVEDYQVNGTFVELNNFDTVVFDAVASTTNNGNNGPGGADLTDIFKNGQVLTSTTVDGFTVTIYRRSGRG